MGLPDRENNGFGSGLGQFSAWSKSSVGLTLNLGREEERPSEVARLEVSQLESRFDLDSMSSNPELKIYNFSLNASSINVFYKIILHKV